MPDTCSLGLKDCIRNLPLFSITVNIIVYSEIWMHRCIIFNLLFLSLRYHLHNYFYVYFYQSRLYSLILMLSKFIT